MELAINKDFRDLIPRLSAEELEGLEANIKQYGCHTAITEWDGIIVDGHNRYQICKKNGLPFETRPIQFADRGEAIIWIIRNQFDRRNLSPTARMDLALRMKSEIQAQAQLRQKAGGKVKEKLPEPSTGQTRDQVAALAGVSGRTLDKYEAVKETGTPELLQATREGKVSIHTAAKAATVLTREEQIEALSKAPGKLGDMVRKEIAKKKEIDEANAWVDEMNTKFQTPNFDPKAERERVHTTHTLYRALEEISALPPPAEVLAMIPDWCSKKLNPLDSAVEWLSELQKLNKEKTNETVAAIA